MISVHSATDSSGDDHAGASRGRIGRQQEAERRGHRDLSLMPNGAAVVAAHSGLNVRLSGPLLLKPAHGPAEWIADV